MNNVKVKQIFESTVKTVLANHGKLFEFLLLVSRLYQFKTTNLLLIYAQRPNAEMVETLEGWNAHNRVVKEESRGIAIFKKKEVHYVFDLKDTNGDQISMEEKPGSVSDLETLIDKIYSERISENED